MNAAEFLKMESDFSIDFSKALSDLAYSLIDLSFKTPSSLFEAAFVTRLTSELSVILKVAPSCVISETYSFLIIWLTLNCPNNIFPTFYLTSSSVYNFSFFFQQHSQVIRKTDTFIKFIVTPLMIAAY